MIKQYLSTQGKKIDKIPCIRWVRLKILNKVSAHEDLYELTRIYLGILLITLYMCWRYKNGGIS